MLNKRQWQRILKFLLAQFGLTHRQLNGIQCRWLTLFVARQLRGYWYYKVEIQSVLNFSSATHYKRINFSHKFQVLTQIYSVAKITLNISFFFKNLCNITVWGACDLSPSFHSKSNKQKKSPVPFHTNSTFVKSAMSDEANPFPSSCTVRLASASDRYHCLLSSFQFGSLVLYTSPPAVPLLGSRSDPLRAEHEHADPACCFPPSLFPSHIHTQPRSGCLLLKKSGLYP